MDKIRIRNMVCDRCIMAVQQILEELGYPEAEVALGEAVVTQAPAEGELKKIDRELQHKGFELIREPQAALVEEVKTQLITFFKRLRTAKKCPKYRSIYQNAYIIITVT